MAQKQKSRGRANRLAQDLFGYEQLRPGQEAALHDVLEGNDTLAVMASRNVLIIIVNGRGIAVPFRGGSKLFRPRTEVELVSPGAAVLAMLTEV